MTQEDNTEPLSNFYYCTRPSCQEPRNSLSAEDIQAILNKREQRYCNNCNFPLVLEGQTQFRYLSFQPLTPGGFGRTFLAKEIRRDDELLNRNCVIKLFCPNHHLSQQELVNAQEAFRNEAITLLKLGQKYPYIPRLFDFFPLENPPVSKSNAVLDESNNYQDLYYIVQQYIPGNNLQQELEQKNQVKFSEYETINFLKKLLKILKLVHQENIIHRDIKPKNIIVNEDGFYLIDFGNVKKITLGQENFNGDTVCRTPGYAPPEQEAGESVDESTDLYALGATAVYLLTGEKPPRERRDEQDEQWNRWLSRVQQYSSSHLYSVLKKMLSYEPKRRYPSAQEVINALKKPMITRRYLLFAGVGIAVGGVAIDKNLGKYPNPPKPRVPLSKLVKWTMATSWDRYLHPNIYWGAEAICQLVKLMSKGKFVIELDLKERNYEVSATSVLNAVDDGKVQCGHTASYYYYHNISNERKALAFGTSVPFGLNARQQNAWFYEGDGIKSMRDTYNKLGFNVIQFPAGNTGGQMGGWFKKEINSIDDLKGLKMRMGPGLGAEVMTRLEVNVQKVPVTDKIVEKLKNNVIHAVEWIGPADDMRLNLHEAGDPTIFYYYPGWWEPSTTFELQINKQEWENLSKEYQQILKVACKQVNMQMLARYDNLNRQAISDLRNNFTSKVEFRKFNNEILKKCYYEYLKIVNYLAQEDTFKAVYQDWDQFRKSIYQWHGYNEIYLDNYIWRQF
ncbi:MAG: serine/threonine-protein kinase [Calothrix sp. MO_167.B12]|nr:serine/threonine-protein kinase [Calothrix sp. MO_167.B12]